MRAYLNTKGSALMLVLCSMTILIAVSSVVIMLSTANVTMSKQYSTWSADYYHLDYVAQDQLATLDKTVLIPAENLSRYYLENTYYQYETVGDFPNDLGGDSMSGKIRQLFLSSPSLQPLIANKWGQLRSLEDQADFEQQMPAFVSDLFKLLYYADVNAHSDSMTLSHDYPQYSIQSTMALQTNQWFPDSGDFDAICSSLSVQIPKVSIQAREMTGANPKKVSVLVALHPPSFQAVEQNKYYAVKANPLYANALSVQGSITFQGKGHISILGDVVSSNLDRSGKPFSLGLNEGNTVGIQALDDTSVEIAGNVYSGGDLHLWGSNSAIRVSPYESPDFSASLSLKPKLLYAQNSPYFFDFAVSSEIASYTEEAAKGQFIPYIYKDDAGGNVYCNNLSVEEPVENGSLTVSGNLWTRDDIQNDGINSSISVGKNYIGMRSDANESNKDPNGSSSVINNGYMYGSTIAIGGDFVIPGTSFFRFANNQYYQSAESGTARAGEYFDLYARGLDDASSQRVFGTYQDAGSEDKYELYEKETETSATPLTDRIARFQFGLTSLKTNDPENIKSGITVGTNKQSYTLGVVNNEGTALYQPYSNDLFYYKAVSGPNGLLDRVFQSKTQCYGTNGFSFSQLIDDSVAQSDDGRRFYYFSGDKTVDVSAISSGILFCKGNLTLTGSGTFQGSVICAGNLTLESGVNVQYSEPIVRSVLGFTYDYKLESAQGTTAGFSRIARQFFSPSTYTAFTTIGVEAISAPSAGAGERQSTNRYSINMWKESKV